MSAAVSRASYFVWDTDKTAHGPMELPMLVSWIRAGRVAAGTWVFVTRGAVWERAENLVELRIFFQPRSQRASRQTSVLDLIPGLDSSTMRRNKLLSDFTDEQLERFTRFVVVERLPQSSVVVKQGDRSDSMYLILDGELTVHLNFGGQHTELATLGCGDFFGDFALFDHGPRSANVVANRSCLLLKLSSDAFKRLSREAPDLAMPFLRAISKSLTARIRASNKHQGETTLMAKMF